MAEEPKVGVPDDEEETPGYKAPAQKTLEEINNMDSNDESLKKYKEALLAGAGDLLDEGGKNVIVKSISLIVPDRPDVTLDLTGDISTLKDKPFVLKEGSSYSLRIQFRVQREIVAGLKYTNGFYRKGMRVDKSSFMLGSYGPKNDCHAYTTPIDEAPTGMIARGKYVIKSKFHDDDKNVYLDWEWALEIKKDW